MMVSMIEEELQKRTFGKHMSALVGIEPASQRRNLIDTVKPKVDTFFLENNNLKMTDPTTTYLTSTVLLGVSLGVILAFGMVYAILQMFDLQSPYSFVEKGIDWGRIEK